MKQYMVLISMVMLGMCIFNLIVGNSDDSIGSSMIHMWKQGIEVRTYSP